MLNIQKGKQSRPQRLVIYGQEGVGKTTLSAKLPAPLVLDTECGSGQIEVDRVQITDLDALRSAMGEIIKRQREGRLGYRTIVLDTADRVWGMCAEAVCRENNWTSIEQPGYGKGMKMATERFELCISTLDRLIDEGLYVVCVCHSKVETVSPPDKAEYSAYQLKVSAPGKQSEEAAAWIKQWADAVIFCQFDTVVNAESGKACAQRRVMRTSHGPCWEAKNRYGMRETLPMDDGGIQELVAAVYGKVQGGDSAPVAQAMPDNTRANAQSCTRANDQSSAPAPTPAPTPAPAAAPAPASAGSSGVASPAPGCTDEDINAWAAEDQDLVDWFRAQGKLTANQGLEDLDKKYKMALQTPDRRAKAVEMARAWKAQQKGDAA